MEDLEQSSLEEKVDIGNLVLFPLDSYVNKETEEENFRIKDERSEIKANDDISIPEVSTPGLETLSTTEFEKLSTTELEKLSIPELEKLLTIEEKLLTNELEKLPTPEHEKLSKPEDVNIETEEENFRIKDEPSEIKTNDDISENYNIKKETIEPPVDEYEKEPIELSTNDNEMCQKEEEEISSNTETQTPALQNYSALKTNLIEKATVKHNIKA